MGSRALEAGDVLSGRYRVVDRVGQGGMGAVYRVFDELVGELVALKLFTPDHAGQLELFRQEVRLARRVTHRNVGRTFDLGRDADLLFLTMELVRGESLQDLVARRGRLPLGEAAPLLAQAAAGLAAAHAAQVVHRDLKPANVLVGVDGRVVVIDFGVASPASFGPGVDIVRGTFDYMAPEQLEGAAPRPAQDVYALGLIVHRTLTGRRAFEGPDAEHRARRRLTDAPDLSALEAAPEAHALVARCLLRDAGSRPAAAELADALCRLTTSGDDISVATRPVLDAQTIKIGSATRALFVARFEGEATSVALDLGQALAEELTDALARTRGLRVLAPPARSDGPAATPPGAELIVRGTIRRGSADGLRVTFRLTDATTETQIASGTFEVATRELLDLASRLAVRIAEALRLELELLAWPHVAEPALVALLEARGLLRSPNVPASRAARAFERALEDAPGHPAAVAGRALAWTRSYILPDDGEPNPRERAAGAVERALELAPLAPDTRLAQALLHFADGDYPAAMRALYATLDLAPTHAFAQEVLGRAECESGHADRGARRLQLALELDGRLYNALALVARGHALRGRMDAFDATVARMLEIAPTFALEAAMFAARAALWTGDRQRASEALGRIPLHGGARQRAFELARRVASLVLDPTSIAAVREHVAELVGSPICARVAFTVHAIAADCEALHGEVSRALDHLERAVELGILDVEWLGHCGALDRLREEPRFVAAAREIGARVAAVWVDLPVRPLPAPG